MTDKNILVDNSKATDGAIVTGKHEATFLFKNKSTDDLSERIYQFLLEKGYKLEVGSKCNATYGKGSKIGRVLLGAFINAICIFS